MARVFISYRRSDSAHQVGRLYDRIEHAFGKDNVFKDVDSIAAGSDFRRVLTERVAGCDVFLAVIGDNWLSAPGKSGGRRIDDPSDFVRIEVEAALTRGVPVIPVLVGSDSMPPPDRLPDSLRPMAFRNAVSVRPDPDFRRDVDRLVAGISVATTHSPRAVARLLRTNRWLVRATIGIGVCLAVVIATGAALLSRTPQDARETTTNTPPAIPSSELVNINVPKAAPGEVVELRVNDRVSVPIAKTRRGSRLGPDGQFTTVDETYTTYETSMVHRVVKCNSITSVHRIPSGDGPLYCVIYTTDTGMLTGVVSWELPVCRLALREAFAPTMPAAPAAMPMPKKLADPSDDRKEKDE